MSAPPWVGFERHLAAWRLTPDGAERSTRSSRLLPVRHRRQPAMLKIAVDDGEKAGGAVMAWWDGKGAARVLAHDADAVLLDRAKGGRSLSVMARNGEDDQATGIICDVVAALHAPRRAAVPALVPLVRWFEDLERIAPQGGVYAVAWAVARDLLASPLDETVLHGDIHHGNILDFGPTGWLAIDPKGLRGERGYDYANIFRNPEGDAPLRPGRFERQVALVAERARLDPARLLRWVLAVMGLSAAWGGADRSFQETTLAVASKAAAALGVN